MPKKSGNISKTATAAAILGQPIVNNTIEPTDCVVCNKSIPAARIQALKSMNAARDQWTHVQCSTVTRIKGLYLGEAGTSKLQLCKKVYNDSVRSVFRNAEVEESSEEEPDNDN